MVRKSVLVYDLLRTEQTQDGFSEKEIVEHISNKHDIVAGKGLRRQVAVALRRGLDFGILAKKNNRFRFDPDHAKTIAAQREAQARRTQGKRKKRKKSARRTTRTTTRRTRTTTDNKKGTKEDRTLPPPRLPKSWTPNRRNLTDEPLSKVKKI